MSCIVALFLFFVMFALKYSLLLAFVAVGSDGATTGGVDGFNFAGMMVQGSNNSSIPLISIDVNATILSYATDVTAKMVYKNNRMAPIECEFVFPITNDAAVYKLEVQMGNRPELHARVEPRDRAMDIYQDFRDSGRQGALLESQIGSDDVYRIILGNLGPGETAVVTIGFAQPMDQNPITGELSVTLPVVLNPRYIPQHLQLNSEMIRTNFHRNVSYVAVSEISYTMNFTASVDMGPKGPAIANIASGNVSDVLRVNIESGNKRATVTLISFFSQDHEFQIRMNVTKAPGPMLYKEPGYFSSGVRSWANYDVLGAWMDPVQPDASSPIHSPNAQNMGNSNYQYWILFDRSGSMTGEKFEYQREALILILKSLPRGCQFNMIGFETFFEPLFNGT